MSKENVEKLSKLRKKLDKIETDIIMFENRVVKLIRDRFELLDKIAKEEYDNSN